MGSSLTREKQPVKYFEVLREYHCHQCEIDFYEVSRKTEKPTEKICPVCQGELSSMLSSTLFFTNDIKTVGQLADKNTRKMGHYEFEAKCKEQSEREHKAASKIGVNLDELRKEKERVTKINKMTTQQKKDYILYGKE